MTGLVTVLMLSSNPGDDPTGIIEAWSNRTDRITCEKVTVTSDQLEALVDKCDQAILVANEQCTMYFPCDVGVVTKEQHFVWLEQLQLMFGHMEASSIYKTYADDPEVPTWVLSRILYSARYHFLINDPDIEEIIADLEREGRE